MRLFGVKSPLLVYQWLLCATENTVSIKPLILGSNNDFGHCLHETFFGRFEIEMPLVAFATITRHAKYLKIFYIIYPNQNPVNSSNLALF